MPIQSMTGFARAADERDGVALAWEIRSVNGKGLDVRLRLPPGWDGHEAAFRQRIARRFARGTIQASLTASRQDAASRVPKINEALLDELAALAQRLSERFGTSAAAADGLLALPGVLQLSDGGETAEAAARRESFAADMLDRALSMLETARIAEGAALRAVLLRQVDAVQALVERVETDPSRSPAAIRERLAAQVRLLLDAQGGLDEDRLAAEASLLAVRADVREEIDRLRMHCAGARALLEAGGPLGRKLDFLGQELNREANTLCSKSGAPGVTAAGLELKAVVDQFREQVQNLE